MKDTIDLSPQPRRTHTERLNTSFPEGTMAAEIQATLTSHRGPGEEFVVHRQERQDDTDNFLASVSALAVAVGHVGPTCAARKPQPRPRALS